MGNALSRRIATRGGTSPSQSNTRNAFTTSALTNERPITYASIDGGVFEHQELIGCRVKFLIHSLVE